MQMPSSDARGATVSTTAFPRTKTGKLEANFERRLSSGILRPDDGGSTHLGTFSKFVSDYTAHHSRRQSSSKPEMSPTVFLRV